MKHSTKQKAKYLVYFYMAVNVMCLVGFAWQTKTGEGMEYTTALLGLFFLSALGMITALLTGYIADKRELAMRGDMQKL